MCLPDDRWKEKCDAMKELKGLLAEYALAQQKNGSNATTAEAPAAEAAPDRLELLFSAETVQALTPPFRSVVRWLSRMRVEAICVKWVSYANGCRCWTCARQWSRKAARHWRSLFPRLEQRSVKSSFVTCSHLCSKRVGAPARQAGAETFAVAGHMTDWRLCGE
jgi:hypothetical protein